MDEREILERSVDVGRIMADVLKQHEKENKRLWATVLVLIVCIAVIAGSTIWVVLNMQNAFDTAMWNALMQAGDVTVTETTQTVEGDSATINNGEWEQYYDQAANYGGVE